MKYATPQAFEHSNVRVPLADAASNLATRLFLIINTWRQRSRTRAQLTNLSSHFLNDIGVSRSDVMIESNKQFWEE
jgi:uncharacterized protein YjiS (DUF1127 family)